MSSCDSPSRLDTFGISMYFSYPDSHCSCLSTALRNLWQIFNILVFKIPHHGANPASYRRNWPARRDRNAPKHEKQNDSDVQYKAPLTTTTTCYSSPQITTIYTLAFQPAMDNTLQSHSWRSNIDLNWNCCSLQAELIDRVKLNDCHFMSSFSQASII